VELDDSIRPQNVTIYRGGTPRGGRWLGRNPRRRRSCCLGRQEACPIGWAYLTQEEAQQTYNNNNNQALYSQVSWDKLEMKPHKQKNRYKIKTKKKEKTKGNKKSNQKKRKGNKTLSQKSKKRWEKNLTKGNKKKEPSSGT
jgi:hypothetical protein